MTGSVLALTACTAHAPERTTIPTSDGTPVRSAPARSTAASPVAVYSAGQARVLLPDDFTPLPGAARVDPLAPFSLTTVGASVSDAHIWQSTSPAMCGVVVGLWYGSAADRSVTDPLLAVGVTPSSGADGTTAVESVRVFPDAAAAAAHFADLVDAVGSCPAFTLTDTQAGTFDYDVGDVRSAPDDLAFRTSVDADGTVSVGASRVRVYGNLLVTVTAGGAGAGDLADIVDGFVMDRSPALDR